MFFFFFSSRRRHTRSLRDWSSDVCSSDLSPLAAAWAAYRAEPVMLQWNGSTQRRLTDVLGPAAQTPDLAAFGLRAQASGARMLAGHLAAVAEYRDSDAKRLTLIRWKGDLPAVAGARPPTA